MRLRAVPLLVVLLAVGGCAAPDREVPVPRASLVGVDRIAVQSVCLPPERIVAAVVEDAESVVVTVTALQYDLRDTEDCATTEQVRLDAPLGARRLVDGSTGREVEVEGR